MPETDQQTVADSSAYDGESLADEYLEEAKRAASAGDPMQMLMALHQSQFLDGMKRYLGRQWGSSLPEFEIEDAIAEAVDATYARVRAGKKVLRLNSYLFKAASNILYDRYIEYSKRREMPDEERVVDEGTANADPAAGPDGEDYQDIREARVSEAVTVARRLVHRIGVGQIRDVMSRVIDAVERGELDLPPAAIARDLGMNGSSVRVLLKRGYERLERLAREEGVTPPDLPTGDG